MGAKFKEIPLDFMSVMLVSPKIEGSAAREMF